MDHIDVKVTTTQSDWQLVAALDKKPLATWTLAPVTQQSLAATCQWLDTLSRSQDLPLSVVLCVGPGGSSLVRVFYQDLVERLAASIQKVCVELVPSQEPQHCRDFWQRALQDLEVLEVQS